MSARTLCWRSSALAALVCPLLGANAEPPSIEKIIDSLAATHPLAEVAIFPDGERLVYGSLVSGKRAGTEVDATALWIANTRDGSGLTRLTACPASTCNEHGAVWSPDGTRIVFVTTDKDEQPQVAVAAADGGSVAIITHAHGPLDTPRWSPDGRQVAFLYSQGAPRTPGPLNPLARDAGVLSSTIYEQRLAIVPARGGNLTLLGPADLNVYEYDWSPDGSSFAITAARGSGDDNWWIAELDLLDARRGTLTRLLKPTLQIASPRWSEDGKRVAYIGGLMSDESLTGGDVFVIAAVGGAPVDVTPALAASVQTITWHGSSTRLIATEFAAGNEVLALVDADAKSQRELWRASEMIWANSVLGSIPGDAGVSLSRNGTVSAVIRQSYGSPPELATGPLGKWTTITHLNAAVRAMTGRARNVSWKSDGLNCQGMLIEPAVIEPGRRYPLVVEVHGGPASAHYPMFPAETHRFDAALASQGFFVFRPNPRGSFGQGEAFTQANVRDFGYGDLRDITRGLDAVQRMAPVDPARIGILGWSYGGYITMWSLTQTHRFKAAVTGAGVSDWLSYYGTNNIDTWMLPYFGASVYDDPMIYEKSSPMTFIKNVRTPTLIVAGDRDAEVPIGQSYEYWNALRQLGVKTEFVVYPDEGHHFFRRADQTNLLSRVVGWFNSYLKDGSVDR